MKMKDEGFNLENVIMTDQDHTDMVDNLIPWGQSYNHTTMDMVELFEMDELLIEEDFQEELSERWIEEQILSNVLICLDEPAPASMKRKRSAHATYLMLKRKMYMYSTNCR